MDPGKRKKGLKPAVRFLVVSFWTHTHLGKETSLPPGPPPASRCGSPSPAPGSEKKNLRAFGEHGSKPLRKQKNVPPRYGVCEIASGPFG